MTTPGFYTDEKLKETYGKYLGSKLNYTPGMHSAFSNLAQVPIVTGSKVHKYLLKFGNAASTGFPNDTSLTHLGEKTSTRQQLGIGYSNIYSRTKTDVDRIESWKNGGDAAMFIREELSNLDDVITSHTQTLESLLSGVGDGKLTSVAEAGSSIAQDASGTITVAMKQRVQIGDRLQVYRSSSIISNVFLKVTAKENGIGQGTITVTNTGSTTYTNAASDELYVAYGKSGERCLLSGVEEGVATAAYPRSEVNNDQIDNAFFRSVVRSGGGASLTYQMIRALKNEVEDQAPLDFATTEAIGRFNAAPSQPHVFVMSRALADQLLENRYGSERYAPGTGMKDPSWGSMLQIDDIQVYMTNAVDSNTVYYLNMAGWGYKNGGLKPFTSGEAGVYRLMSGTIDYEAMYVAQVSSCCVCRSSQGKITNVTGFDASSAGLS